jgi:hypothetical protein
VPPASGGEITQANGSLRSTACNALSPLAGTFTPSKLVAL